MDYFAKIKAMFEPQCKAKNICFEFEDVTKATTILVDGSCLNQIIFNLLSNEVKFTPEGGIISVESEEKMGIRITC